MHSQDQIEVGQGYPFSEKKHSDLFGFHYLGSQ
jgi:hypothetical protein